MIALVLDIRMITFTPKTNNLLLMDIKHLAFEGRFVCRSRQEGLAIASRELARRGLCLHSTLGYDANGSPIHDYTIENHKPCQQTLH